MEPFAPQTIDDETIRQIRDRIVEACNPETIILFGSVARGETGPESDIDLLVVVDIPRGETVRSQIRALHGLFMDRLISLDIMVLTPEDFRWGQHLPGHLARVAAKEGIRIYGK